METHLAILLAPYQAYRKAAAQLTARRLVANSAVEAGTKDMQLGLAHGALETKQQSIVEQGRMIDTIGIADERVGEAAEIKQAIPVGIIASETGDFEAEHDADVSERDLAPGARPFEKKIVGVTDPRPCDELIDKSAIFPGE